MKHIFIVNPVAGAKDAGKGMVPAINKAGEQSGVKYGIEVTHAPGHARELALQYAGGGEAVRLYAVGGDGTLNEVFAGSFPFPNAQVASVPVGSGNDFIRSFGSKQDFLDLPRQILGDAMDIDLMQTDGGICAAITSTGLDADVAYNIPKYRRVPLLGGSMAYNLSVLECVLKHLGQLLQITIDGQALEGEYLIATACNGKTYGGGWLAAPMAKLNDGILDVILVKKISRLRVAQIIGKYKKGRHFQNGEIAPDFADIMEHYTAKEVIMRPLQKDNFILNVDGECEPAPRLYAKALPLAGRFVLPKGLV